MSSLPTQIAERCVLFADLRGSTTMFASLGNAAATAVVSQSVVAVRRAIESGPGRVVKTLGDGLMAVFAAPEHAVRSATQLHGALERAIQAARDQGSQISVQALRLQVCIARGEVVEVAGDCFGDAVNVAARLLDHAGDNEVLATVEVLDGLAASLQQRFRKLDRLALRGRAEPVEVYVINARRVSDTAATLYSMYPADVDAPDTLVLGFGEREQRFSQADLPALIGRSPQAQFHIEEARVSRSHARLDWQGGGFELSDLSFNGTFVQFGDGEVVSLRRGSCLLHGSGSIGLSAPPNEARSAVVTFSVLRSGAALPEGQAGESA